MLDPDDRVLYIDALRPPPNMTLARAAGTTFTLDLTALLIVPVALTTFDLGEGRLDPPDEGAVAPDEEASARRLRVDPILLLEVVRRYADRIDQFCQAGQIRVSGGYQPILTYLEDSIHPVAPRSKGHVFHPKVWVLHFEDSDADASHVRVLVASRNLTFDRSWDVLLRLDEHPTGQIVPGIAEFLDGLPALAVDRLAPDRAASVASLAERVRSARFAPPEPFIRVTGFHTFGMGADPEGVVGGRADRALILSPFLTARGLTRFIGGAEQSILVSRQSVLDRLGDDALATASDVRVFDAATSTDTEDAEGDERAEPSPKVHLTGLHAKVYVAEQGGTARILVGSANATTAALGGNVEVLVSLEGRADEVGIDPILGGEEEGLQSLLQTFIRSAQPLPPLEQGQAWIDVERAARFAATLPLLAQVTPDGDAYRLHLTSRKALEASEGMMVTFRPLTLAHGGALTAEAGRPVDLYFGTVSLDAITPFFEMQVTAEHSFGTIAVVGVVTATLLGAPEDRRKRVLASQLGDRDKVIRYLLMLLTEFRDSDRVAEIMNIISGDGGVSAGSRRPEIPLFESMVRALVTNPESLDRVHSLITELRATEEGAATLPDGIDEVWEPIWEARERLRADPKGRSR